MKENKTLKNSYTKEEAKAEIDAILEKYGKTCKISFRETDAEIVDSYLVNSKKDRADICEIISRTGLTKRSSEDLAAEWMVHNTAFEANVGKSHAKDVSLDYKEDPRKAVRIATAVFDKLNIE